MEALIAVLPIALIALACPLLMLFLMRGAHHSSGGGPHHTSGDPAERLAQIEGELEHLKRELTQDRQTAPVAEEELAPTVPGSDRETSSRGPSAEGGNAGIFRRLFSEEGKVTDPVCAMSFPAQGAAATTTYGGTVYHFCSGSCQSLFEGDPEVFALKAARRGLQG